MTINLKEKFEKWGCIAIIFIGILGFLIINLCENNYNKGKQYFDRKDYQEAVRCFLKDSQSTNCNIKSFYYLGLCYNAGIAVKQDSEKAREYFQKVASYNGPDLNGMIKEESLFHIGMYYANGNNMKKDYNLATQYFRQACQNKIYGPAAYRLGRCYYEGGHGIKQDYFKAAEWLKKSLDSYSLFLSSMLMRTQNNSSDKEMDTAAQNLLAIGQSLQSNKFQIQYSVLSKGFLELYPEYERLEISYGGEAEYLLGECYYYGKGVKQDYSEAAKLYQKSVRWKSDPEVYCAVGRCYQNGHGTEQNFEKAAEYYQKAADQGNVVGLKALAWHYLHGRGVKKDPEKARELEEKAKKLLEEKGTE